MTIKLGLGIVSGIALAGCLAAAEDGASSTEQRQARADEAPTAEQIYIHAADWAHVFVHDVTTDTWRSVIEEKPGSYYSVVDGPYTVVVACPWGDGTAYTVSTSQTLDDEHMVWVQCDGPAPEYFVSGTMAQAGRVSMGDTSRSSTSTNWSFELATFGGTYDVVANSPERIAIRRGLTVNSDLTIPAIDLVSQGTAFVELPVTITNPLPGDTFTAQTYLQTLRTFAILGNRPLPAKVIPQSALIASDRQDTSFRANGFDGNASITRFVRRTARPGAQLPVTFGQHFTGLQVAADDNGDLRADWSTLHSDFTYLTAYDFFGNSMDHLVTKNFLDATGGHSLTLSTQIPNFPAEWRLDLSAYNYSVNASYGAVDNNGYISYLRNEDVFSAAARRDEAMARGLELHKPRAEKLRRVSLDGGELLNKPRR